MARRPLTSTLALLALFGCSSAPATMGRTDAAAASDATLAADMLAVTDAPAAPDVPAVPDVPKAVDVPAEDVAMVAPPYPEGPYGNREGAVIANLEWEGYVNETGDDVSTSLPFGPTSLQALRGNGRGYALIQVAEFL